VKRASSLWIWIPELVAVAQLSAQTTIVPDYLSSTVVNAATGLPGGLAPNSIATVYGVNLATGTRAVQTIDIASGRFLPFSLSNTNAFVSVGGVFVPIYYASPSQINFVVPSNLVPGKTRLTVTSGGIYGAPVDVTITPTSPGLFVSNSYVSATDVTGQPITNLHPAAAGEWVILYATGLGETLPRTNTGELVSTAASAIATIRVWVAGQSITPAYAGLAPGFAGLYQINVFIPANFDLPANPEIRLEAGGVLSPPGVFLPIRKPN
jgi:uncharacterized protein (TIGR03437 family)